jgi:membrane protease YdiL (CAAX protease family)
MDCRGDHNAAVPFSRRLTVQSLFITERGAIRAPWRIALFCVMSIGCLYLSVRIVRPMLAPLFRFVDLGQGSVDAWVTTIGVLGGTALSLRLVDRRPWKDVWLDRNAAHPRLLALGFGVGAVCIGVPILVLIASGWLHLAPGPTGSWWGATVRITLLLLPAALLEELITRGYILSVLRGVWGWPWAIAAMSIVFGLGHLANDGVTVRSVGLVTLAGVFLATVLYVTRSLYAAWMAHFAWNWVMAAVFHVSVSGIPFEMPSYRYVEAGPVWATGGDWGPEGGLPAALGMGAGMAVLIRRQRSSRLSLHPPQAGDGGDGGTAR